MFFVIVTTVCLVFHQFFFLFFLVTDFCHGLQNVALLISPPVVQRGNNVTLICQYDLEGSALYAVKWYRGQYEFYRFTPSEIPTEKIFLFPGINVDVSSQLYF